MSQYFGELTKDAKKESSSTGTPATSISEADMPRLYWENTQGEWEESYTQVVPQLNSRSKVAGEYGDHEVNQQSVISLLPRINTKNKWLQGRPPSNTRNEIRVFVECDSSNVFVQNGKAVIASGISHDQTRREGKYWVYERQSKNKYKFFKGQKHRRDVTNDSAIIDQ
ncbi:hypothetical protein [Nostoc sp.]|uniref:hypothetical protein n=1 Tax=Nostoc sp. TaxID=1180 RepID=UPI002FF856F0